MVWSLEPGIQWFGHVSVEKRSYHGLHTPVHLNFKGRFDEAETANGRGFHKYHKWRYPNSWMAYNDGQYQHHKMDGLDFGVPPLLRTLPND